MLVCVGLSSTDPNHRGGGGRAVHWGGRHSLAFSLPESAPGPRLLLKMAVPGSKHEVHLALAGVFPLCVNLRLRF